LIPDTLATLSSPNGVVPGGFLAGPRSVIGYAVLVLVAVSVVALGRRIPPVMVGIVLLSTASLFPVASFRYYLVFALPIAALVVRDPDGPPGSGIFDRLASFGGRRRIVAFCVSLATALTIAQIPLPIPFQAQLLGHIGSGGTVGMIGTTLLVWTTAIFTPILWLVTCAVIVVSYGRRPSGDGSAGAATTTSTVSEATPAAAN
jgi:hypothetical protein